MERDRLEGFLWNWMPIYLDWMVHFLELFLEERRREATYCQLDAYRFPIMTSIMVEIDFASLIK